MYVVEIMTTLDTDRPAGPAHGARSNRPHFFPQRVISRSGRARRRGRAGGRGVVLGIGAPVLARARPTSLRTRCRRGPSRTATCSRRGRSRRRARRAATSRSRIAARSWIESTCHARWYRPTRPGSGSGASRADREQAEVVVVLGAGRLHEHAGAVADLGDHFEAERLPVERGGSAGVADVEHGVVQTANGHAVRNPLKRSTIPGKTSTKRSMSASVRRPADRDAQRVIGVDAHRRQHRRRLEHLRRARRPGVHGDAVLVEREQDRFGFDAVDADAQQVGQRSFGARIAEALDPGDGVEHRPRRARSARAARAASASRSMSAHAAPKPTHAGTFSMPPRRARSCAPPTSSGGTRSPRRTSSAPAPFGPPNLCAVTEHRSAPSAREVDRHVARRRARVDVHEHAALARRRARSAAAGCTRADLVVRELHRHQHRVGVGSRRAPRPRRTGRRGRRRPTVQLDAGRARSRRARTSARPRS